MKRFEFDGKKLSMVTSDVLKVLKTLDEIIDSYNNEKPITQKYMESVFKLEFDRFRNLLGKYMSKCLVTISEPYNEALYIVSIDKCIGAGFLPELTAEFYNYLKTLSASDSSIDETAYEDLVKFYKKNHDNILKLYNHMIEFANKYVEK